MWRRSIANNNDGVKLYVLFLGDDRLSDMSLNLLAVCDTLDKAISLAEQDAKNVNNKLSSQSLEELRRYKQTQCLEENYLIKEVELNELQPI